MQPMQRARSETAKSEREDSIITVTEVLLRQSGYDSMTMQAVAKATGLAKGTLYLYFTSRESLVVAVYDRLFDRWIDRFAVHQPELAGFVGFCRDFARHYSHDPLFLQLAGFANTLLEAQLDREAYIKSKRGMARRVKRLAGLVCQQFFIEPVAAQKLIWGFLTIAGGTTQMTGRQSVTKADLPDDVIAFIGLANFETVFLNAATPLGANIISR
ncbi:TetR/AcrR family transcriptional regulator [Alphaproteobacteria bacterium]|nr:TetR/AcrR family transcriptional regulator [Alphaproteobacteria bacterium]